MRRQKATHEPAALPRPGPTRIPPRLRVVDDVPHDQEVRGEAHRLDDAELVLQPLEHDRGRRLAVPVLRPFDRELAQVRRLGVTLGHREARQHRVAELELDVGALRDPQRGVTRFGHLVEQAAHLDHALQVVLVAVEPEPVLLVDLGVGLHAQERVVGHRVALMRVVAVVRGEQRHVDGAGDLHQLRVRPVLIGDAVVLELDEEVVATEDVLEPPRDGARAGLVVLEQRLEHLAAEAARGRDDPFVVVLEQLPVHLGLLVVALEVGAAGELDQVLVAGEGLRERGEVVVGLAPALDLAAGVVHLAVAPRRALRAVLERLVELGADDRRDPDVARGLVHVEDAVHVAVVGDADRRLPVGGRGRHDVADPRGTIEHRVLGVHVKMDERLTHSPVDTCGQPCGRVTPL